MKKLLLLAMIILPSALLSQTVSGLKVMPGAPGSASTVTFDVSWDKATLTTPWLDSMWVFVDYNKNGKMERLLISGGTLTEHTATKTGTGIFIPENDMGAWVYGDARTNAAGSFSAKVQLFTKETDIIIAGACAYASSYPPLGQYVSDMEIVFTGTPMYEITLVHENGFTFETIESGGTFLLPCSYTISSFTDATGAPGVLSCIPSTDIYNLTVSATTYCAGDAVTFALDNTTSGRTYQLYRDDVAVMDVLTGTGNAETFTGTFAGAGNYVARVKDNGTYCAAQMTGTYAVSETVPDAPTMGGSSSYCTSGTITAMPGLGGSGIRWTDDNTTVSPRTVSLDGIYYAVTTSDSGCESIPAPVTVAITQKGDNDESAVPCGCAEGTIECNGMCKTDIDYTENDGVCAACGYAYVRLKNPCGEVINATHSTYPNTSCGTKPCYDWSCTTWVVEVLGDYSVEADCQAFCIPVCAGYAKYNIAYSDGACDCYCCN
jgi:hypothetical protein